MNKVIYLFVFLFSALSLASEHGAAHEGGIPKVVFYQALNFFLLIGVLYFLLRSKVTQFFNKRHDTLKVAVNESKRLKDEAEKRHQEYTVKLQKLETDMAHSLEKMRSEGEQLKKKVVAEAQKTAQFIEEETRKIIATELERAKKQLFEEALEKTLDKAQKITKAGIQQKDQQKMHEEFIDRVGANK